MVENSFPAKVLLIISFVLNLVLIGWLIYLYQQAIPMLSPLGQTIEKPVELPLLKYSFDELKETTFIPQTITFGESIESESGTGYISRLFNYAVEGRNVSGIAHFPDKPGQYPVIIMARGYVDKSIYESGIGSNPAARYFAQNGYITLSPDRLGYGTSDEPPEEPFADRFISYSTMLQLIADLENINDSLQIVDPAITADTTRLGMWAHSNGGQIALSVLELTDRIIPTVLWAPVSKPFPYSVLYYTDEFDDNGKYLRKSIADFESKYDIEKYTFTNYLDSIQSPIQLHQGGNDDSIPLKWSDTLNDLLKENEVEVEYNTYPQADHNMVPDWSEVARSSLQFLNSHLND